MRYRHISTKLHGVTSRRRHPIWWLLASPNWYVSYRGVKCCVTSSLSLGFYTHIISVSSILYMGKVLEMKTVTGEVAFSL
jgi:hypothetical protein